MNVSLQDIEHSNGAYRLNGPYVHVSDFYPPNVPAVSSPTSNFLFNRSQTGFEDVMVYYYIDASQRYLQNLGYTDVQNNSIEVDSHGLSDNPFNAAYIPSTNSIAFGTGGVGFAEDAEVIWHEYGHAIQHAQIPGTFTTELNSMGEGFGDYWAASYAATVSTWNENYAGKWVSGMTAPGQGFFGTPRTLTSNYHYPENYHNSANYVHDNGMIWSAALWQIRAALGRNIADKLVLQSHTYLTATATMDDGAAAIITADLELFQGAHVATLSSILVSRGFEAGGGIHGEIQTNQTWSGTELLFNGDVTVPDGVVITISPGSEIITRPSYDFTEGGYYGDKVEFLVDGTLNLSGEAGNEITHSTYGGNPDPLDWGGIAILELGSFNGTYFNIENAEYCIYGEFASDVQIENANIGYSGVAGIDDYSSLNFSVENTKIHDGDNFGIKMDFLDTGQFDIINCEIYNNDAYGIYSPSHQYGTAIIKKNTIYNNAFGISISQAQTLIENNTVVNNGDGVAADLVNDTGSYTKISNNAIISNDLNGQYYLNRGLIILGTWQYYNIRYNDVWGNNGQNYYNCDDRTGVLGNISEDPLFDSNFNLTWANEPNNDQTKSPCIDTGDPNLPDDPDFTTGDIGAKYYDKTPEIPTLNITTQDWEHPYLTWNSSDLDIDHYTIYKRYYINKFNQTISYVNDYTQTSYTDMDFVSLGSGGATAYYKISATDLVNQTSGWSNTVSTEGLMGMAKPVPLPDNFSVEAAFPNPFNPSTTLEYGLPVNAHVDFRIYDMTGRLVYQEIAVNQPPGWYALSWRGENQMGQQVPSGVYLISLTARGTETRQGYDGAMNFLKARKVILMK